MKRSKRSLMVAIVVLLVASATGFAASKDAVSIEGAWTGEIPRGGSRFAAADFEFRSEGSTLTGRVRALDLEFPVVNGTIAGSHITFNIGETKGDYAGDIDGDRIQMTVKYSGGENGRQTLGFVLTRVKR